MKDTEKCSEESLVSWQRTVLVWHGYITAAHLQLITHYSASVNVRQSKNVYSS